MKAKLNTATAKLAALALLITTLNSQLSNLFAQGTAFTYQGQLADGGNPANGFYDFQFRVFDTAPTNTGTSLGTPNPNSTNAVPVSNGLFSVTVDFGNNPFATGAPRWLDIAVRSNATGSFSTLNPRQELTATPYAITASNLTGALPATKLTGTLPSSLLSGLYASAVTFNNTGNSFSGNGAGLAGVNAVTLGGYTVCSLPCYWNLGGNAGTLAGTDFIGTTDNQPLELKVNGMRCMRLEDGGDSSYNPDGVPDGAPNVILGAPVNYVRVGVVGATIAGGGAVNYAGVVASNSVAGDFSTVGGGGFNQIGIDSLNDVIAGGYLNQIADNAGISTIGGGYRNAIDLLADAGTIGGGEGNHISEYADRCFIGGGFANVIASNARYGTIGGGFNNTNISWYGFIGGGQGNSTTNYYSTVAGGVFNHSGDVATVCGGQMNTSSGYSATVGGGEQNVSSGTYATIPGGLANRAQGAWSFAAGSHANAIHAGAFVWADSQSADFSSTANNQFNIRAAGGVWLNTDTSIFFGNQTRQMLNLWGTQYTIGVQSGTEYFRTDDSFSWFRGGAHHNGSNNPGGGDEQMRLDASGNLDVRGDVTAHSLILASDRKAKEHFAPVDARAVLDKVAALPLSEWNFKTDSRSRHIGPMAQDFYAAFQVGEDDKHIAVVDEGGVALAAIQGLNQKLTEQLRQRATEITELKQKNQSLEHRLDALEKIILTQKSN